MMKVIETLKGALSLGRPDDLQVAALCMRDNAGAREILMLSSLSSKRWIVPKGWPMNGKSLAEAALQEAWEEGGVKGMVGQEPLGSYSYAKVRDTGLPVYCRVQVYPVTVSELVDVYPEAGKRQREWMRPEEAASLVAEPELSSLLRSI
jgi:8-oxo-dGTP pyrophosphatase MutT (NUDIX family)